MVDNPVVPGYPSQVTCTGAGLRAKTRSRLSAVCILRSTRMSIWSLRTRSAVSASESPAMLRQTSTESRSRLAEVSRCATWA